jgi:polysaccharide biosynthesis transport protein
MPTNVVRPRSRSVPTVLKKGWAVVIGVAIVFGLGALAFSLLQKPVYQASTTLYITSGNTGSSSGYDTVEASKQRVATYAQLAHSGAVLTPALESAGLNWSLEEARQNVEVESRPEVVTLTIYVRAPTPEVAQKFAGAVADSMVRAVSALEVPASGLEPAARLSVVTPATVASKPAFPTIEVNVLLAAVIGLFVGALTVLLREALNKKIRDAGDAEAVLGTRTLAVLPRYHKSNQGGLIDFDGEPTALATSFRNLRSRLILELSDQPHPKLLITSACVAEGETTVAINVGAVLAHAAKSVVIVDANIDDPQVVQRVGARNGPGLTDAISGAIPLSDAVQRGVGSLTSLAVLGAGTFGASHPDGLFSSAAFVHVLDDLAQQFDYVIIDAPPLLVNLGTESLLSSVDGVVVVTRPNVSTIADLVECRTRLENGNARLLGVVVSDPRNKRSRHRKIQVDATPSTPAGEPHVAGF